MIGVLDYGIGNVASILNMLKKISIKGCAVKNGKEMDACDKLILPGIGAFDTGMTLLTQEGRLEALQYANDCGKPILGICLGMQLLGRKSEEGKKPGLGFLPFDVKRFQLEVYPELRVPHMGWNDVKVSSPCDSFFYEPESEPRFYFVHSYHAVCDHPEDIWMTCDYGETFTAAVQRKNLWGVQFHPEKSHRFGMELLNSFARGLCD